MNVLITLSTAGASTGPTFNLYSDVDTYATPFETGVPKASLVSGYTSTVVPNAATIIRVQSVGVCNNFGLFPIAGVTTTTTTTAGGGTTTTTTAVPTTTTTTTAGGGTTTTTTTAGGGTTTTTTTIQPFDYYYAEKYECPDCILLEANVIVKFPPGTTVLTNKNYISFSGDFNYRITGPAPYSAFSNQMQTVPYDNCNAVCNPVTTTTTTTIAPSLCYNYNAFNNNEETFTLTWTECDGTPRSENVPASSSSSTFCAQDGSVFGFNFTIYTISPCGSPTTTTTTTSGGSPTTTTTTTAGPSPTTTTTTTAGGINHPFTFPISIGTATGVDACAEGTSATAIYGDVGNFTSNAVYYNAPDSNDPYIGGFLYYKNTTTGQYVQINDLGQRIDQGIC